MPTDDDAEHGPKQRHVMETVTARIASGEYGPGKPIPSIEDLANAFGYSKVTVNNALRALAAQAVLEGSARSRYRVTGNDKGSVPARVERLEANDVAQDRHISSHAQQLAEIRRHLNLPPAD